MITFIGKTVQRIDHGCEGLRWEEKLTKQGQQDEIIWG